MIIIIEESRKVRKRGTSKIFVFLSQQQIHVSVIY